MKAAIVTKYGGPEVIEIVDVAKPTPKSDEILIKVKSFGVTSGDVRIRSARFPQGFTIPAKMALGIFAPRKKILGSEFSGIVEEVGNAIDPQDKQSFKPGDEVIGLKVFGIYAEYICMKATEAVIKKPKNMSFNEAASLPFGASTALYFLNNSGLEQGQTILINGASGAVGSNTVQIAKARGFVVTGICSTKNIDFVKSLGAENVIDYKKVDIKKIDLSFDAVFDAVGNLRFEDVKHLVKPNGVFLQAVATVAEMFSKKIRDEGKRFFTGTAPERKEDLQETSQLFEAGKLKANIDKVFQFDEIRQAHEYVEKGHKVGSVVVTL